jgi:hypothetical protein
MKFSVVLSALFAFGLAFSAQAAEVKDGHVICQAAKTDFTKRVDEDGYYTVLKQFDLKIGEQTGWVELPSEEISVSFFTFYDNNDPSRRVYLSTGFLIGGYEIWSSADTYRGPDSRFGTSIAKGTTQY